MNKENYKMEVKEEFFKVNEDNEANKVNEVKEKDLEK